MSAQVSQYHGERHGGTRHLLNILWIKVPGEGPHFLVTVSSYRILMRATLSKENRQLAWHQAIWIWVSTVYRNCLEKVSSPIAKDVWIMGNSKPSGQEEKATSLYRNLTSGPVKEKNMAQSHLAHSAKPERNQEIILNNNA